MNVLYRTLVLLGVFLPHLVWLAKIPSGTQKRKAFVMEYFENCAYKDLPMTYANFTFIRNDSLLRISGEEIVTRDLKNPLSIQIRIERCKDKSNLNACDYFTTLKWSDMCTAVTVVPFLKAMFQAHSPPLPCPIKKNHYYLKNGKVELDLMASFLAQGSGTASLLKIHSVILEGTKTVSCANVGMRIADVKVRP